MGVAKASHSRHGTRVLRTARHSWREKHSADAAIPRAACPYHGYRDRPEPQPNIPKRLVRPDRAFVSVREGTLLDTVLLDSTTSMEAAFRKP